MRTATLFGPGVAILVGFIIRVILLLYGQWQDATMAVKYTDIDYRVFSEASGFVINGGSPYERSTYRYTPLLAWLMIPNYIISPEFGKWLFIISDAFIGLFIHKILKKIYASNQSLKAPLPLHLWQFGLLASWLFNPIAINVSSRGNAEALISLLVLYCLHLLFSEKYFLASLVYGLAVHFKVYPLIFAPALFMFIDNEKMRAATRNRFFQLLTFTRNRSVFTFCSAATFILITLLMYMIYGYEFLWETYLYHVVRKDHRHNFSAYFYQVYLSTAIEDDGSSSIIALLAFIPQIVLLLAIAVYYHRTINFCVFIQTLTFVIFNKVCTVQYFIWYFSLLPLALVHTSFSVIKGVVMVILWFISQGVWLYFAYRLEFLGENTFLPIWIASVGFFLVNIWILLEFVWNYVPLAHQKQIKKK